LQVRPMGGNPGQTEGVLTCTSPVGQ
jgi:hypothetical protein